MASDRRPPEPRAGAARLPVETAREHVAWLARSPRLTDAPAADAARAYCAGTLAELGFRVVRRPFEYSAFPGRYGTPLAGLWALITIVAADGVAMAGRSFLALALLAGSASVLAIAGGWLIRWGVLSLPMDRRRGVNLEATRGNGPPAVWLVAHVDSKSQLVPMLARISGIGGLVAAWILSAAYAALSPRIGIWPSTWGALLGVGVASAVLVIGTLVGNRSPGAVDNASGVAAVLLAAAQLSPEASVGVLITDAEELGLAGARAWARDVAAGVALNCDGIDDDGTFLVMYSGRRPARVAAAVERSAKAEVARVAVRRVLPGVLVDGVAFADAGWEAVTISRGTVDTLRRIHTPADDVGHLAGTGIPVAARMLARTAAELC